MPTLLEEEIINLQKDLIVYVLFSEGIEKAENTLIPWYAQEFSNVLKEHGPVSEDGIKAISIFFRNASLLLENPIIYDNEKVRQELVIACSSQGFTQALMSAGQKFSEADRDRAKEILNGFMYNCIEKSKNPEDVQKALAAKAARLKEQ